MIMKFDISIIKYICFQLQKIQKPIAEMKIKCFELLSSNNNKNLMRNKKCSKIKSIFRVNQQQKTTTLTDKK